MGSRGAFVDALEGDFSFKENGQTYFALDEWNGIKALIRPNESVKAPEYSHSPERIYAIVQKGELKHLAFYDKNHKQAKSIDLLHAHHGVQPHKHIYLNHTGAGIPITSEEQALVDAVKRRFHLR